MKGFLRINSKTFRSFTAAVMLSFSVDEVFKKKIFGLENIVPTKAYGCKKSKNLHDGGIKKNTNLNFT